MAFPEAKRKALADRGVLQSSCSTLKGFLSPWRRFFGLGLHADSSIRENARRERGRAWPGFKKEFGSQKNSFGIYAATA
jgi:hypothetical protein